VSSCISPVPNAILPNMSPSVAFPLKVSGSFFGSVLTSPDFCHHPSHCQHTHSQRNVMQNQQWWGQAGITAVPATTLPMRTLPMHTTYAAWFSTSCSADFAMLNLPQATPANCLPTHWLHTHNMTSKLWFCACSNIFFFLFFPLTLYALPPALHPQQPALLAVCPYAQKLKHLCHCKVLTNICPMPSLQMPPPCASLPALTEATHTHNTCKTSRSWCFCGDLNQ